MFLESKSTTRNWGVIFILGLTVSWALFSTQAWAQTYVSGKVLTADGRVVASGAVALEKGELCFTCRDPELF